MDGKLDRVDTWSFDLSVPQMQNCLEMRWKIGSCDRTLKMNTRVQSNLHQEATPGTKKKRSHNTGDLSKEVQSLLNYL